MCHTVGAATALVTILVLPLGQEVNQNYMIEAEKVFVYEKTKTAHCLIVPDAPNVFLSGDDVATLVSVPTQTLLSRTNMHSIHIVYILDRQTVN